MIAAGAWAASEPVLGRAFGTPYSDVRLLGKLVTRGGAWPIAGVVLHLANGAVFGWCFERVGLSGTKQGVLTAEVENLALWPGFIVVDRIHPDRREGRWPRLLTNRRVATYEVATHALFGLVLGGLVRRSAALPPSVGGGPT